MVGSWPNNFWNWLINPPNLAVFSRLKALSYKLSAISQFGPMDVLFFGLNLRCGVGLVILVELVEKDELLVAHADLVAGVKAGGMRELIPVEIGAVLGRDVVEFATVAGVDQDGTVAAGNERVRHHNVAIGCATDRIDAN